MLRPNRKPHRRQTLSLAAALLLAALPAQAAERLALVLGNGSYDTLRPVASGAASAEAMAAALGRVGFDVVQLTDAARADVLTRLQELSGEATEAEAVVIYYAGHAVQLGGANYLLPRDASFASREDITGQTLAVSDVVAQLQPDNGQVLVFLDAARASPLPLTLRAPEDRPGLAATEPALGQFIALATQPDVVAPDLGGALSLFTAALVDQIEVPGLSISDMMIAVREATIEASSQSQVPWDASNLSAQFYFVPQIEQKAGLTEADLAMINDLDEESLNRLLVALGNNGVALEIIDVEEEEGEEYASLEDATANPILELEDVEDTYDGTTTGVDVIDVEQPDQVNTATGVAAVDSSGEERVTAGTGGADAVGTVGATTAGRVSGAEAATTGGAETMTGTTAATVARTDGAATTITGSEVSTVTGSSATVVAGTTVSTTGTATTAETATATGGEEVAMLAATDTVGGATSGEAVAGQELGTGEDARPSEAALAAIAAPPANELPLAIQTEMARVGCHRGALDGSWGPISRVSLLRYYAATGSVSEEDAKAAPTETAYKLLKLEPGVVCEGTVAPVVASKSTSSRSKRVVVKETKPTTTSSSKPRIKSSVSTDPTTGKKKIRPGISAGITR